MNKRKLGKKYEELASKYLIAKNYKIIETNFFSRFGEIDIIAKDVDYLVFVEVKFRNSRDYGYGYESVNKLKQNHIIKTAKFYMYMKKINLNSKVRFDVLSFDRENITLFKNAFP